MKVKMLLMMMVMMVNGLLCSEPHIEEDGLPVFEVRKLKIVKVYSARFASGHIYRSYVVKWDDSEVVIQEVDNDYISQPPLKKGDVIPVAMSEIDFEVNGNLTRKIVFQYTKSLEEDDITEKEEKHQTFGIESKLDQSEKLKIQKIYKIKSETGAGFLAYAVKWKGKDVVVHVDDTSSSRKKIGDDVKVLVTHLYLKQNKELFKYVEFHYLEERG